jgi:hypothetical protein
MNCVATTTQERKVDMRMKGLLAALFAVAAAATTALPADVAAAPVAAADTVKAQTVKVTVVNRNWLDVRVYAVTRSGDYDRLGTVTSMTSQRFTLPLRMTAANSELRLVARTIGANRSVTTEPILVSAGEEVELWVENSIRLTSYRVWGQ